MRGLIFLLMTLSLGTLAQADQVKSIYTNVDVSKCKLIDKAKEGEGEWAQWRCKGYQGFDTYVLEADIRFYITYDKKAEGRETLGPFNTIGKAMEWRLVKQGRQWQPYATILRYYTDNSSGQKGQVLVVSKFNNGKTCHVAYIDAVANKNANKLARVAADNLAENFKCGTHRAVIFGKAGASPM